MTTMQDKNETGGDTSSATINKLPIASSTQNNIFTTKDDKETNSANATSSIIKDAVSTALSQFDLKDVLVQKKPNQSEVDKKAAISKHIKRPMNAFMVWAQAARRALSKTHPTLHNAQLSKTLGNMWHQLKDDQKKPFMEEANRLRDEHKCDNPGYKYQPKRRPKMAFLSQTIASSISSLSNHSQTQPALDAKSESQSNNNHVVIDSAFKHKYRKVLNSNKFQNGAGKSMIKQENKDEPNKDILIQKKVKFPPTTNKINKPMPPQSSSNMLTSKQQQNNNTNSHFNNDNYLHLMPQQEMSNRLLSSSSQGLNFFQVKLSLLKCGNFLVIFFARE